MRSRRPIWFLGGAIILAIAGVGGVLALRVFGGDTPAEVALTSDQGTAGSGGSAQGSWTVDMTSGSLDDATSTFAGYRIQEEVVGVGAHTAVGRTKDVTGTLMIGGNAITSLSVEVDMTTLASDDDRRDGQLRTRGLETDTFPTATFQLTEPIEFTDEPVQGETVTTEANGELTVHGVTREVHVPVEARWTGDQIEVAARFDIALADYKIDPPTGFLVLSVADQGTIELHLLFAKA